MSTCVVPQNQPIYQALLDKAATYPADKPYQAKAYKKAAESILTYDRNIYDAVTKSGYFAEPVFVGEKIAEFIYNFVENPPVAPVTSQPAPITPIKCIVDENQPIYEALLDKAATYPADKTYQAKAYKKAAESISVLRHSIYYDINHLSNITNVGEKIQDFIYEFLKANPAPLPLTGAAKAMDDARNAAALNAPKDVTTWPDDAAERAAFQERLAASKQVLTPEEPQTVRQIDNWWKNWAENQKPVSYTAENPRRSKRLANKPKVEYFTKEDEDDEIAEAIEAVCAKKGWAYDDELVTEFNTWLPTAEKYCLEMFDYDTDKFIPRTKIQVAKEWAQYYSTSLKKQQKEQKLFKGLIKYCEKNNIEYDDVMADKLAAWMADPANKELITYTYKSYGCICSSCNPNGTPRDVKEYSYERSTAYCIKAWFSTLKKIIVW